MDAEEVPFLKKMRSFYFVAFLGTIFMIALAAELIRMAAAAPVDASSGAISWSWPSILLTDFFLLLGTGVLFFEGWANLHIRFTETEVIKPGLFGKKVIPWCDVVEVVKVTNRGGIRIVGRDNTITFSPFVFKEPEKLDAYLERQRPSR